MLPGDAVIAVVAMHYPLQYFPSLIRIEVGSLLLHVLDAPDDGDLSVSAAAVIS
jgi:hypothetical protein